MSGVYGWITNQTSGVSYSIIRRSPEIDALLRESGHEPSELNVAHTPLVGACEYAKISVLILHDSSDGSRPPLLQNPLLDGNATSWQVVLSEPGAIIASEPFVPIPDTSLAIATIAYPVREDIDFPSAGGEEGASSVVTTKVRSLGTLATTNSGNGYGERFIDSAAVPGIPIPAGVYAKQASNDAAPENVSAMKSKVVSASASGSIEPLAATTARFMLWDKMLPVSIRELRRSAVADPAVSLSGRPRPNDQSIFIVELVDSRYLLQGLFGTYLRNLVTGDGQHNNEDMKDSAGRSIVGGTVMAAFNMLAETPIGFEAQTVAQTILYPPSVIKFGTGCFDGDPNNASSINSNEIPISNIATASTCVQNPWSLDQLLQQFSRTVLNMTNGRVKLSREIWDESVSTGKVLVDDGDVVNLDFRGMTTAAALDVLAQRIGAAWVWDRADSCLALQLVSSEPNKYDTPDWTEWMGECEVHRVSGYINSLTLDIPRTIVVSHESVYCSTVGPYEYGDDAEEAMSLDGIYTYIHLVDHRHATTEGGFVSTRYSTGLNTRASMLWHTSDSTPQHLTVEVKDHIPAFIGSHYPAGTPIIDIQGSKNDDYYGLGRGRYGVGELGGLQSEVVNMIRNPPWNFENLTFPMAFKSPVGWDSNWERRVNSDPSQDNPQRFRVTLKNRRSIYEQRFERLRAVLDGDMTCNRMPPPYWNNRYRSHTPSVGLQYDIVEFGNDSPHTVTYRIYGKNTHPLLYPQGAQLNRTSGGPGVHSYPTNGTNTITVRNRASNNIKRAFLCQFYPEKAISKTEATSNNPDALPYIWLYRFVEVTPEINAATMLFSQQDALGFTRAEGYALNLCEMNYRDTPNHAWDGGMFQFKRETNNIALDVFYPTPPQGMGICYEVYARSGFTMYYIFAPNGTAVDCAPPPSLAPLKSWPYMGVSGISSPTNNTIAGDIMGA